METTNGPWTIRGSKIVYQNPHIRVVEDQVAQPDGQPGSYATVQMKTGVCVLPIDRDGSLYLTRQFRYAIGSESLEAACGGMDEDGDPRQAAGRELREELGIEAQDWRSLGAVHTDTSILKSVNHLFLARELSFTRTEREGTETIRTVKLSLEQAVRMVMEGEIVHAVSGLLILKAWQTLQGAPPPA